MTPLATITGPQAYDQLIAACRARSRELQMSFEIIDHIAGWPTRYGAKLFAVPSMRTLGPLSLGLALGTLALKLVVIEDPEALEQIRKRVTKPGRTLPMLTADAHKVITVKFSRRRLKMLSKLAAKARVKKIPARKRSRLARKAAKARWAKPVPSVRGMGGTSQTRNT